MTSGLDIRWIQRFANYQKALLQLKMAVRLSTERSLSELEVQGMIQAFEYTQELAWNVMKDYLEYQGIFSITGSRDAIREAFNKGLIAHGELWMETIHGRNMSSHTYNEATAKEVAKAIVEDYFPLFEAFEIHMQKLLN